MGKRSDFKRVERDFYPTPAKAVEPLIPFLNFGDMFCEPCVGDGALVKALESQGLSCIQSCDIEPKFEGAQTVDVLSEDFFLERSADYIITNPPWTRSILHPMIEHFASMKPTWLLFDADWLHTRQSAPFMPYLQKVVSVGRVSWMGNGTVGKDNCAWYLFDKKNTQQTQFFGRVV